MKPLLGASSVLIAAALIVAYSSLFTIFRRSRRWCSASEIRRPDHHSRPACEGAVHR